MSTTFRWSLAAVATCLLGLALLLAAWPSAALHDGAVRCARVDV